MLLYILLRACERSLGIAFPTVFCKRSSLRTSFSLGGGGRSWFAVLRLLSSRNTLQSRSCMFKSSVYYSVVIISSSIPSTSVWSNIFSVNKFSKLTLRSKASNMTVKCIFVEVDFASSIFSK